VYEKCISIWKHSHCQYDKQKSLNVQSNKVINPDSNSLTNIVTRTTGVLWCCCFSSISTAVVAPWPSNFSDISSGCRLRFLRSSPTASSNLTLSRGSVLTWAPGLGTPELTLCWFWCLSLRQPEKIPRNVVEAKCPNNWLPNNVSPRVLFFGSGHIRFFLGGVLPQRFSGPPDGKDRPSPWALYFGSSGGLLRRDEWSVRLFGGREMFPSLVLANH